MRSWSELEAGKYSLPGDATHFRWSYATAEREKMCDKGRLYELADKTDRPGARPSGPIKIYPYIVTAGENGADDTVTPCTVKAPIGGGQPIMHVIVDFEANAAGTETVQVLADLLKASISLNNKPAEILALENERLRKENDEQKQYIATCDGGPWIRFCNDHPEIVTEGLKMAIEYGNLFGRAIKLHVAKLEREAQTYGELDVTPKNRH